ncbi:Chromo domain-containing protein [Trichoderma simmonsii]|uniref:Chromo domain-containing protein n=1 Tax=Trichoderma simmonsii TaxID=1491479 RepID=A0A8G0LKV4_9HYPO|nr:Chromo domain-containing protein [Trichoderma simmonsii]
MASGGDSDDEISITSTDDENGDELFVDKVLAERLVHGEPRCLIQWKDLPIEEATWEPRENVTDELMGIWEKNKADQRNGLVPKFRLKDWKDAFTKSYESKLARHNLRNIVRARRGYPTTTMMPMYGFLQLLSDYPDEEEEEAGQAGSSPAQMGVQQSLLENPPASHTNQSAIIPETSSAILIEDSPSPQGTIQEGLFGTPGPDETRTTSPPEKLAVNPPAPLKSALKSAETTTRASVRFILPPEETSREVPRRHIPSNRGAVARSTGYANVFAGGRTRKGRGTLSEAAANPEVNPKFLNSRLRRKIELQRRDREGIKAPTSQPSELISLDHNNPQLMPSANGSKDDDQTNGKRRSPTKGVAHWEDEPMDIDPSDSLFVSDQTPSPAPDASDDEMTQPDTDVSEEQPEYQAVSKTVQLGPEKPNTVTLSFDGIPQERGLAWADQFRSDERLVFTHTCNSRDLFCQTGLNGGLSVVQLCEGTVVSYTELNALKSLAGNLRLGSLGLLSCSENFCVYMFFPENTDGQPTQDCDDIVLKYHIFKPVDSLTPSMLASASQLMVPDKSDKGSAFWSRPLNEIFGQKYEQLLPVHARDSEKHNFYLAFPHRAEQEAFLLTGWLRDNRSDSDIRVSYAGGSWSSFMKLPNGVVIIHEDMLWAIRKIPRLNDLLHGRRTHFTFWIFSRSLLPVHPLGSEGSAASPLGDIRLYRVFDPGAAFLITPSFLVSEPEHAYSFLKWFWNNYVKTFDVSRPRKLVLCAKIDEWMNNLYLEQTAMRRKHPVNASEEELSAKGISEKAIECRWKSFKLIQQLIADAPNGNSRSIILAPEAIDGNDEQSLVNWFGEWSILNIEQYRRYTVIGCGWQTETRRSRTLQAPIYEDGVVNDPDEALSGVPSQPEPLSPPSGPRAAKDDESTYIKNRLFDIIEEIRQGIFTPVKLYLYPVGYSTSDVGFRLGDITQRYFTYEQWFEYHWRVFNISHRGPLNTYGGLFYTFDEQQASSRTFHNVQRSPWAALIRPINPHVRPWKNLELFIWDINYLESSRKGKTFCYADLPEGQQRLIDHIQQRARDRLPLKKVWVGAVGARPSGASALDATIQWLDSVITMVRDWIPAPAYEISNRGWSLATPERSSEDREDRSAPMRNENDMKGNLQPGDDAPTRKRIFHPPQGHGQYKYTKCRNRLHQAARQFDPKLEGKSFEYLFKPTIDWYTEQCEEGRGFEHIKVMAWRDVFQVYKIEEFLQKRG